MCVHIEFVLSNLFGETNACTQDCIDAIGMDYDVEVAELIDDRKDEENEKNDQNGNVYQSSLKRNTLTC